MKKTILFTSQIVKRSLFFMLVALTVAAWLPLETSASSSEPGELINEESIVWPDLDEVRANAWVVFDRSTKEILLARNPDQAFYPASTTKIMTAILALEQLQVDQWTRISQEAATLPPGSSKISIAAGDRLQIHDLLGGLMVASGNDAANALAEAVDGNQADFVVRMNQKAAQLGLLNSHFVNPSGLHDDDHVMSAHDLALLTDYAMENEDFRRYANLPEFALAPIDERPNPDWGLLLNSNKLLFFGDTVYKSDLIKRYLGVKTGMTSPAQSCLVAAAELVDGRELISVLLGIGPNAEGYNTFNVTKVLMEQAAQKLALEKPLPTNTPAPTTTGQTEETTAEPTKGITADKNPGPEPPEPETKQAEFNPWRLSFFVLLIIFLITLFIRPRRRPVRRFKLH